MDSKLKPCPHCGSVAVHSCDEQDGRDYICCLGCTARVSARGIEAAENIWNKRVVLAQEVDAPASADPFMPSPEVRAALRTVFYVNS